MIQLPDKVQIEGPNFIRSVFERGAGIPNFISFGIGNPATEAIPVQEIEAAFDYVLHRNPIELLQYGPMNGDAHLAELILERLHTVKKFPKEGQQLVISIGAGQCLGLVPRTICNPGDEVFMEHYTFTCGFNAARLAGAEPVSVAMDEHGMIPEALEEAAKSGKGKYIYLIPNFQNPTGITMPLERRRAIYDIACRYDLLIYEDDPYGDIRFAGTPIPSFKEMDVDNRVLYAGSFSKTVSAGLRVGFLYGPKEILGPIQMIKNNSDGQMPLITQRVVARLLDTIDFDKQIAKVCQIYKEKCDLMLNTFKQHGHPSVRFTSPEGGMFVWMTMPDHVDCNAFFETCMANNVGIITGAAFTADGSKDSQSFRLSYTYPTKEDIVKGMKIIAALSHDVC